MFNYGVFWKTEPLEYNKFYASLNFTTESTLLKVVSLEQALGFGQTSRKFCSIWEIFLVLMAVGMATSFSVTTGGILCCCYLLGLSDIEVRPNILFCTRYLWIDFFFLTGLFNDIYMAVTSLMVKKIKQGTCFLDPNECQHGACTHSPSTSEIWLEWRMQRTISPSPSLCCLVKIPRKIWETHAKPDTFWLRWETTSWPPAYTSAQPCVPLYIFIY